MKKRNRQKKFIKAGLVCACILCAGSITTAYAAEEVTNEMQEKVEHIYKGKDIFKAEPLAVKTEPELEIGEGELTENNPEMTFDVIVPRSGYYCVKLENINADCSISCWIYDDFDNEVDSFSTGDGGKHIIWLEEGISYKLRVGKYNGETGFVCTFMQQPPTIDISDLSHIQDQVLFENQRNIYKFTPKLDGIYRLELTEKTAQAGLVCYVWDSYGVEICDFSDGKTVFLEEGMEYEIQVRQYSGFGKYTFEISHQKERKDITGYTQVDDTIQFSGQENTYTLIPPVTGIYHMGKKNIRSEFGVNFLLKDCEADKWLMDSTSGGVYLGQVENGIELEAGKEYRLYICENGRGRGDYSVYIEYPEDAIDFLKEFKPEAEEEAPEVTEIDKQEKESNKMSEEMNKLQDKNKEMEEELDEMKEKYEALMEMLEQNEIVSE